MKKRYILPVRTMAILLLLSSLIIFMNFRFKSESLIRNSVVGQAHTEFLKTELNAKDSVASVKAFAEVYKVLMSPRCMNCHPSGDVPLQGDDSHLHAMLPKRGKDGKGLYAMKCTNCHQPTNIEGLNKPPGHPDWHLPPANMKMVFEGRTPNQLAKQLVNPRTNGNKSMQQLIEHADDGLVKAGWNPGEGRTLPPLSHEEFKKVWITWIKTGAYAPPPMKAK
ncbi:cytochrome c [Terrimonas sp. NA20]|uniref:Cytochrome c n=1 Tax=Terrimonas ginsenosidimutans TaxID=2908004 RepID=A0ABS9KMI3_9BACT|nr:cytochrome c [Terrimonas ginsenosidimutans]